MSPVSLPEPRVARKREPKTPTPPTVAYMRVELQVPPDWMAQVDAEAERLGLSRSAYIRQACVLKMDADRRAREGK